MPLYFICHLCSLVQLAIIQTLYVNRLSQVLLSRYFSFIYILPTCEASYCCLIETFHYQLTDSCIPLHERHRCVLPAAVSSNFAVADRYKFRTRQVSETMSFRCIGISNAADMAIIVMYRLFFILATSYCTFT